MLPAELVDHLYYAYKDTGFKKISRVLQSIPASVLWCGGIESKTINRHRAVCVFQIAGSNSYFDILVEGIRAELHRSLKASFWRGLGVGLVVFSPELIEEDAVEKSVYSRSQVATTLIQWIINVSLESAHATIAHTFAQVSTTPMVKAILDTLGIPDKNRNLLVISPVSLFKVKLW